MASCFRDSPWKLYFNRAISAWGDRMWMFAVGLFMVELSPGSLKWPAIYGLTQSLSVVFVGSVIGRWVDRTPRFNAARLSLAAQNVLVVLCAVCVALTFYFRGPLAAEVDGWGLTGACSLIVVLGTLAHLASVASSIVVYKDWVAVMADGDSQLLATMNSTCRSIDLAINMIAPIAVGQIMYFVSHIIAAVVIASWNVVSFLAEFLLLWKIYGQYPRLAVKERTNQFTKKEGQPLAVDDGAAQTADESAAEIKDKPCCHLVTERVGNFFVSWRVYFGHEVRNAGLGLACLYMTVLGFDSITAGYAYSQGVPESVLGILQAVGAGVGLAGSLAFPLLVRCLGVVRTGLYGFALEVACLTLCVGSVWAPGSPFDPAGVAESDVGISNPFGGSPTNATANSTLIDDVDDPSSFTSVILLMTGIVSARFGLWVADLSVNQALQEVEDQIRGTVNGVQSSMNMIMDTMKFLLVIACPWPQTFGILVCTSFAAICAGWAFYASYLYKKRGHLLPFHRVVRSIPPDQMHQIPMEDKKNLSS